MGGERMRVFGRGGWGGRGGREEEGGRRVGRKGK